MQHFLEYQSKQTIKNLITILLIAWMAETISQLFAFDVTSEISSTLHFLLLCTASAGLYSHLEARRTASPIETKYEYDHITPMYNPSVPVTSLCTIMSPTPEQLATRVPTRGRGLRAF